MDNIYDAGRSIYTRHPKISGDFVNWLNELFTALALGDQINLMGLSYGGWLTSQYTLRFSERLNRAVLLAPGATVVPISAELMIRGFLGLVHRRFFRSFLYWLFADWVHRDENGRREVEEFADDTLMAYRCFKPKAAVGMTVLTDKELQSLKVPTLYLEGEHEKTYSARKAVQRLKTVAPQIRTEIIPHAGHDLVVVQAETINRKVLEFLKQP